VAIADSAPVCVIRTTVQYANISTDTERCAGLSAIAELLVIILH